MKKKSRRSSENRKLKNTEPPIPIRVGRPRKFQTVDDIYINAQKYFDDAQKNRLPFTVTGLCIALGTFRDVLMDYESGKYDAHDKDGAVIPEQDFSTAIKAVKIYVENYAERHLYGSNPTGPIFALKNFKWKDKIDHEIGGPNGGPIEVTDARQKLADKIAALAAAGAPSTDNKQPQ